MRQHSTLCSFMCNRGMKPVPPFPLASGTSWEQQKVRCKTKKGKADSERAVSQSVLRCVLPRARRRMRAYAQPFSPFILLFPKPPIEESNQAIIGDSFHIVRPVATPLPLRLLPQMVFQNHVAFPGSQAAGISTVRTKQRCVP